ncbi:MAG: hypothetical protein AAGC70_07175 [Pseudomonadota bacterium]
MQHHRAVIMVDNVMAMTMQCPEKILQDTMAVAVFGNDLRVLLQRPGKLWSVRVSWRR